jgi:predicted DNA-binding transcriptional regulator YafY
MSNVATRLLSLILLMQTRPTWKACELAKELDVSERTIHRYMSMLDEMGVPIYSERGPYGGFSLVRGYKLPPLIFSAEEATVLYMGANLVREVWGRAYGDAVTAVTAKLDNVLPDDLRQQVDQAQHSLMVGDMTARDYRPWEEALHTLRECVLGRCRVQLTYRVPGRQVETSRVVDPYALSFQWGLWYLVGFCHLRQGRRTFRVDRIEDARALPSRFEMPPDFSVREYLARSLWEDPPHSITVELQPRVLTIVRDLHGHWMDLREQPDGTALAHFAVHNLEWTTGWVLSLGSAARVLAPPELARRVIGAARGALSRYQPERHVDQEAPSR